MKKGLVSIVIPCYNVEKYVEKCIDSIINQTYKNIDIILIDDGSTDLTGDLCDKYCKEDQRVSCIHQENMGISAARNVGINYAQGEFIVFVDSDDYLHEDYVERMLEALVEKNSDIVCCRFEYNDLIDGKVKSYDIFRDEYNYIEKKDFIERLYNDFYFRCNSIVAWGKIAKTELYKGLLFPKGKYAEDAYLILELLERVNKICFINKVLYFYRQHSDSISHGIKNKRKLLIDELEWRYEHILYWKKNNDNKLCKSIENDFLHTAYKNYHILNREEKRELREKYRIVRRDFLKQKGINFKSLIKYQTYARYLF